MFPKKTLFIALIKSSFMSAQTDSFKLTFNHQALCVKQLERTGDFYKTILGFKEIKVTASQ